MKSLYRKAALAAATLSLSLPLAAGNMPSESKAVMIDAAPLQQADALVADNRLKLKPAKRSRADKRSIDQKISDRLEKSRRTREAKKLRREQEQRDRRQNETAPSDAS